MCILYCVIVLCVYHPKLSLHHHLSPLYPLYLPLLPFSSGNYMLFSVSVSFFKRIYLFILGERGREEEKHRCVFACCTLPMGTWPTAQARVLTGNRTGDPLFHGPTLNPLTHISQGCFFPNPFTLSSSPQSPLI